MASPMGLAARLTGSWVFWVLLLSSAFAMPIIRSVTRELPAAPTVYGEVPAFEFIRQDGSTLSRDDLRGKIWVANFIFTSCSDVCPGLSSRMREIQNRMDKMGDAVHLVSFSVDPARDTPEKLQKYAARFQARPDMWSFVTGDMEAIQSVVEDGFKLGLEATEVEDTGFFNIVHGERFVLVDQLGQIRGYFRANDEEIQRLLNTAGQLGNMGPVSPTETDVDPAQDPTAPPQVSVH